MKKRRALSPLTRKLLRDLKDGWKSFLAIFIICTLAVTLYAGIDATWRCIEGSVSDQFTASSMAHIWVQGAVSDRSGRDIQAIPGIAFTQRRVVLDTKAEDLVGEPAVSLIMNEDDAVINKPLLWGGEGTLPQKPGECLLQTKFAKAHGIRIGDSIQVKDGDRVIDLVVTATGAMPEYVVTSDGNEMATSPFRFGYAWVAPGTLSDTAYTQIAVRLTDNADENAVIQSLQALFDEKSVLISGRDDIFGIKMAMEEAQQIRAMNAIFPVVFFIIAALITWTTMSRLVENQRLQIGSLFAMGYGRRELLWHYATYGLLIAVLGLLAGLLGARFVIAPIIMYFLRTAYDLPGAVPTLNTLVSAAMGALMALITGGASFLSAVSALQNSPAALLRPKPPGKGKRVFLENMRGIWARVSFSGKMILRNMLRNPVRLLMGLIGAAGCTALMLTGFGLRDSVDYVMVNHYTRTMHYDLRVNLVPGVDAGYPKSIALRAGAAQFEEQMITAVQAEVYGQWKNKPVYVLEDQHEMIRLYDETGSRVTLPQDGAVLTRKAAEDMGLTLGDTLLMRLPGGRAVEAPVRLIIDIQLDQGIYLSRSAWERLHLRPFAPTALLLKGDGLNAGIVSGMDGVDKVRTLGQERENNAQTLEIMNVIVLVLVLFSGTLALVVFYNLGQLNFSERIRELATLKVLGFLPGEIKKLVLRENVIITLMGIPFGMVFGPGLHYAVLTYGLPNTIQFVPYIAPLSFGATVVLTVLFALLVNWMLGAKFKEIDMVQALKSTE